MLNSQKTDQEDKPANKTILMIHGLAAKSPEEGFSRF
jgi:hypothetical protein